MNYDIPQLPAIGRNHLPEWLIPYRQRIRPNDPQATEKGCVHFFLDDYRFNSVWTTPQRGLEALRKFDTVMSPDFSVYRDRPLAEQLWNTYRNRWCGAYWTEHGKIVIPTVSWGNQSSFDFCFLGLPRQSIVAISTVGLSLSDAASRYHFMTGFTKMLEEVEPTVVLCYGRAPQICHNRVEMIEYPTHWSRINEARKGD